MKNRFESFEDYEHDIVDRGKLINKALTDVTPSEAIALLCTSIDLYCASKGFKAESTLKFYDHIAYLGRFLNR